MKIVADENVDQALVDGLRQQGHDVTYIAELSPGISDEDVLQEARARSALLLTEDKDFGDMLFRKRLVHAGVVLIRLPALPSSSKAKLVASLIDERGPEMSNSLCVVTAGAVRIRRLQAP